MAKLLPIPAERVTAAEIGKALKLLRGRGMPRTKCTATAKKSGKKCGQWAVLGSGVCKYHGGTTQKVLRRQKELIRQYLQLIVDPDQVLLELALIAQARVSNCYDDKGQLKRLQDLDEPEQAALAASKTSKKNLTAGDGVQEDVVEIRMFDKLKALELLGTNMHLFVKQLDVNVGVDDKILEMLDKGRARVQADREARESGAAPAPRPQVFDVKPEPPTE